jgi:polysaccharide export outer membrane protein
VDTGDILYLNFKDINIFTRAYSVNPNGEIFLPEIGFFSVKGQTTQEIKSQLLEKYKEVIINPKIEVSIYRYRPLSIYIGGEVNRPGLYELEYKKTEIKQANEINLEGKQNNVNDFSNLDNQITSNDYPRLFDALQKVDGLTNKADLSSIKIVRKNSKTFGGGTIKAKVNLIRLLKNGDQSQNIRLFDGDYIFIPASENILLDQIIDVNRTNLNPRDIQVFITGNVVSPGSKILRQNTSLVEAIMSAGGKQNSTGNIQFIRLKRNGNSEKRIFGYDQSATKGSYKNPILIEGDLIILNQNLIGKATSIINEVGTPIINSYGLYKIFE